MQTSDQIGDIAAALAKAQGAMRPAAKDSANPHFKSKYADLASSVEAAREPLAANGLAVLQDATLRPEGVAVTTRIVHASGQWIEVGPLTVPLAKADAHGVGSATTYARRYGLGAALGLVAEDDDGNAAAGKAQPAKAAQPEGFGAAWGTLTAAKDEAALKAAWTAMAPELRHYITSAHKAQWDVLKAKHAQGVAA